MKFQKIKAAILLGVIYSLLLATGCPPKKDAIRSAVDASYRLPATTNDVIRQVGAANDAGILSLDQTHKFGELLSSMARAEVVFVASVKGLNDIYVATGQFDPAKLHDLKTFFDASIVGPFLTVLELTRVLSGTGVQAILLAVTAARLLIRSIGSGFGSSNVNKLAAAAGV